MMVEGPTGHEQTVHDGVEGKDHEGGHRGCGEVEKLLEKALLFLHFG